MSKSTSYLYSPTTAEPATAEVTLILADSKVQGYFISTTMPSILLGVIIKFVLAGEYAFIKAC